MQAQEKYKDSKCVTLASPKKLYDTLLFHIHRGFGEEEKDGFVFGFRDVLPVPVLESRKPLTWFRTLEQRGKLSWNDANSLVGFLADARIEKLLSDVLRYQARIRVIVFFQKSLQVNLPELCLDEKFNEKWSSEQQLPRHYLKKCQDLLRGTWDANLNRNRLRCLFSKAVILLENSCQSSSDVQLTCLKLLYLADLFYKRFKGIIVDDKELLNIQPLPSGRFISRDSRRRLSPSRRSRRSISAEVEQQLDHGRGSLELVSFIVRSCLSFVLGYFASLLLKINSMIN